MRQLIARIDDELHGRLKAQARAEGRSLNVLVTELLRAGIARNLTAARVQARLRANDLRVLPRVEGRVPPETPPSVQQEAWVAPRARHERRPQSSVSLLYADPSVLLRAYFADEPEHTELRSMLLEGEEAVVRSELSRVELASATHAACKGGITSMS